MISSLYFHSISKIHIVYLFVLFYLKISASSLIFCYVAASHFPSYFCLLICFLCHHVDFFCKHFEPLHYFYNQNFIITDMVFELIISEVNIFEADIQSNHCWSFISVSYFVYLLGWLFLSLDFGLFTNTTSK